ncbi:MAG TPA: apolipoprotein N-acyltransferase [Smithella sp.]|nr:apolipoprotein N-acyltransferase [Smithella sp.]HNY50697.1 apolipoprotein N-acyltransferase [Smithella sp.]HOG90337.1 apolipoprotein N-acyltransferase [Smithella sp.]HOU50036.1 apolipoprotein N-acyltransferase [Smithella sp.]HQG64962.1 apolipoprotein N-acyltransferase [Smithella sp.]
MKSKKNNQTAVSNQKNSILKAGAINVFCAALSGILLFLSFPKYGSGWLAWIAFIPLFFALKNVTKVTQGLFLGFMTGLVSYIGIIYWIAYVTVHYGHLPLYVGLALMLLLACYLSIYISLFAGFLVYLRGVLPLCLSAPVLWVSFEYGKSVIITGFPWSNLGYSQYLNSYLIQFADVAGVFGLSFLIVLINATLWELIGKKTKKEVIVSGVVCALLLAILLYGYYRIDQVNKTVQDSPGLEVSLIQGNIDQSIKWNEDYQRETLDIYEQLSLKNAPGRNGLIVWPETAAPFRFQDINALHDQIVNLAVQTKSWLLFGSVSYTQQADDNDFFNSAFLLSPSGEIKGRYDKVHLVPYGEYVPLRKLMPFVEGFTQGIGDFDTGSGFYPLSMDDRRIGVLICYEGILASAARDYKKNAAELLVNITNDAWFGDTSAPFQHFSMAVLRAVETRLYLVRAANTGISGIIDPTGKIIATTGLFQKDALKGHVKFVKIPTIYDQYGDMIVAISFILMCCFFITRFKGRSKKCL